MEEFLNNLFDMGGATTTRKHLPTREHTSSPVTPRKRRITNKNTPVKRSMFAPTLLDDDSCDPFDYQEHVNHNKSISTGWSPSEKRRDIIDIINEDDEKYKKMFNAGKVVYKKI